MSLTSKRTLLLSTALASAVWGILLWLMPALFLNLERMSGDWAWRLVSESQQERRVILVDINEESLSRVGPWPWSRQILTKLSDQLHNEGVALQVFDIVFPEITPSDDALAKALNKNNAVLSQVFALTPGANVNTGVPQFPMPWKGCPALASPSYGYIANAKSFNEVPVGHISASIDSSGQVREQPAFVCYDGKPYPALFLVALSRALNSSTPFEPDSLNRLNLEAGSVTGPSWWVRGLPLPGYGVALNERGEVRIPWWTPSNQFVSLSASDILEGRVQKGLLNNAWVVVGSTAMGLNDRITSPFDSIDAGLIVHAQLLKAALDGSIPVRPSLHGWLAFVFAVSGCLLLWWFNRSPFSLVSHDEQLDGYEDNRLGRSLGSLIAFAVLLISCLFALKVWALLHFSFWFEVINVSLFIAIFALILGGLESLQANLQRARLFAHLSSYLPKPVAEVLAGQDPNNQVNAAKRKITVMVADIRNFSAYCECRPAEESTALLHSFFSMATEEAERFGGRVESFQGDSVLMVWDADSYYPHDLPPAEKVFKKELIEKNELTDPDKALDAAISLFKRSQSLWIQKVETSESIELLAPLSLGIGVETGVATVGSVGLSRRRSHMVLGRSVMVAARIQQMTAELSHPILVGEGAAATVSCHRLLSKGTFLLEGLNTPCHIYAYPLEECLKQGNL